METGSIFRNQLWATACSWRARSKGRNTRASKASSHGNLPRVKAGQFNYPCTLRERGCAASAARAGGENCAGAAGARVRLRLARCERHELSARVRGENASGNLRDANGCEPARVVALENERARMPTSTPRLREPLQKDVPSRARVSERRGTDRGEQRRKGGRIRLTSRLTPLVLPSRIALKP